MFLFTATAGFILYIFEFEPCGIVTVYGEVVFPETAFLMRDKCKSLLHARSLDN